MRVSRPWEDIEGFSRFLPTGNSVSISILCMSSLCHSTPFMAEFRWKDTPNENSKRFPGTTLVSTIIKKLSAEF